MYNPSHFQESRLDVLHGLIRQQPLSTLVTSLYVRVHQDDADAMAGVLEAVTGACG
ncbi:MAG: FMN-binding negative transcriptional regulator [Rhodoferax sp.]|nr:FMN-binding negative transcriptional regulator [Rhodoferax sp.]